MESLPPKNKSPPNPEDNESLSDSYSHRYYTPSLPSALGGKKNFLRHLPETLAKKEGVDDWLSAQDTYTLHRPIVRKFVRRDTVVAGPGQQYQADLIDIQGHKRLNEGHKYILTVIDVFSKRAWAEPLKTKTGVEVAKALDRVLLDAAPKTLQTDKGKEFLNSEVRAALSKHGVRYSTENSSIKASVVERFNRTQKHHSQKLYQTRRGKVPGHSPRPPQSLQQPMAFVSRHQPRSR
jgi:transposase InsO family protein